MNQNNYINFLYVFILKQNLSDTEDPTKNKHPVPFGANKPAIQSVRNKLCLFF
jgi:hypothetical protein